MPAVVARVREQPGRRGAVTSRGGLDVVDPGERAPGPRVAPEKVAPQLDRFQRIDRAQQLVGRPGVGVERDAEEVQPRLSLRVPYTLQRLAEGGCEVVARGAAGGGE